MWTLRELHVFSTVSVCDSCIWAESLLVVSAAQKQEFSAFTGFCAISKPSAFVESFLAGFEVLA